METATLKRRKKETPKREISIINQKSKTPINTKKKGMNKRNRDKLVDNTPGSDIEPNKTTYTYSW